jgi:hypothetical protein
MAKTTWRGQLSQASGINCYDDKLSGGVGFGILTRKIELFVVSSNQDGDVIEATDNDCVYTGTFRSSQEMQLWPTSQSCANYLLLTFIDDLNVEVFFAAAEPKPNECTISEAGTLNRQS